MDMATAIIAALPTLIVYVVAGKYVIRDLTAGSVILMAPIRDMRKLKKNYGQTEIQRDINVAIDQGDFLVLVGPSGSGTSTLLHCIAGLEPISGGFLSISGRDNSAVNPKDRDIAMVFQSYALYPTITVVKNITLGMKVRGVDPATQAQKPKQVAKQLQIEQLLSRRPGQLSGGQRQRIAMGRALVRDPKLFLFAEPNGRAPHDAQQAECMVDIVEAAGADSFVTMHLGGKGVGTAPC